MSKRSITAIVGAVVALALVTGGAVAASRYIITSIHQIKPSVRARLKGNTGPAGPPGVVSHSVSVDSEKLTLQPGQTSYEADPNNFQATCPSGDSVIGTGFYGPEGPTGGFVLAYGTFVGGFFANESSIPISNVHLEAICAPVPNSGVGGSTRRKAGSPAEAAYQADLKRATDR